MLLHIHRDKTVPVFKFIPNKTALSVPLVSRPLTVKACLLGSQHLGHPSICGQQQLEVLDAAWTQQCLSREQSGEEAVKTSHPCIGAVSLQSPPEGARGAGWSCHRPVQKQRASERANGLTPGRQSQVQRHRQELPPLAKPFLTASCLPAYTKCRPRVSGMSACSQPEHDNIFAFSSLIKTDEKEPP